MNVFESIREKVKDYFKDKIAEDGWNIVDFNADISNIVSQVEQEYNHGWIPCSERMPEESYERYLVTTRKVVLGEFIYPTTISYLSELPDGNKSWEVEEEDVFLKVIAWQPLPQSYKEGE